MTMTTTVRAGAGHWVRSAHGGVAPFFDLAMSLFERLRSAPGAAAREAVCGPAGRPVISPAAERELATIRTFARFIEKNPDMPADHRNRFLARILCCCEELREELS